MGKRRPRGPSHQGPDTLHGSFPSAELDLHGVRARQAELRVESFLRTERSREPGAVVRVVTGRGSRSPGKPVLQGLVRELLEGPVRDLVDDFVLETGGGSYLVRLRR